MNATRRQFLAQASVLGALGQATGLSWAAGSASSTPLCTIERLTRGPQHHFFGYYGICPWSQSGRYLLSLQSSFQDHMPGPDEPAVIGLVDAKTGEFSEVAKTHAWNFQQGAMLHWNPLQPDTEILYNDREGDEIVSTLRDVGTGKTRRLSRAVSAVSHNGRHALSMTYGRIGRLRKVVGYAGVKDPNPDAPHPDNDGIFLVDLTTGQSKLIVSFRQVYNMLKTDHPELVDKPLWSEHAVFNRSDTRFLFLARTWGPDGRLQTGMFTANLDGSDLRQVIPYGKSVSHFDWRNDKEIVATFNLRGQGTVHVLFTDGRSNYQPLGGGRLDFDGHCTFSPNQRWLATDRGNSRKLTRSLLVYDLQRDECTTLAELDMKDKRFAGGDLRCDFHPRWNRTGDAICFDAIDSAGTRQLHVARLKFS
ncbi:MAG: hypothetical protein JW955_16505 [Sedimentisphaerales bacterium]|nr:hypothetical protein [Sedimentisphaerales bacterium]